MSAAILPLISAQHRIMDTVCAIETADRIMSSTTILAEKALCDVEEARTRAVAELIHSIGVMTGLSPEQIARVAGVLA
ncbi:hypothetical protein ACSMXM_05650 [Pacificimonas sp. ICDLI1SI03]